ncbi:bpX5 domain-containing protein [Kitasatospora sp. NPDC004240]
MSPPHPELPPSASQPGSPSSGPSFALNWERREPPLPVAAVLALDTDVPALAAATRERIGAGARLGVLADDRALLVLGEPADLPWSAGARYLGREDGLLVPTTARPRPAAPLWRTALGARDGQLCVLLPGHALVADPPPPATDPSALTRFTDGAGPDGAGPGGDGGPDTEGRPA